MVPSGLIDTDPLVPAVLIEATANGSPSGSLADASTLMSIAVSLSVDAETSPAVGRQFGETSTVRDTTLLRLLLAAPSLTGKLMVRDPFAPRASESLYATERSAVW